MRPIGMFSLGLVGRVRDLPARIAVAGSIRAIFTAAGLSSADRCGC